MADYSGGPTSISLSQAAATATAFHTTTTSTSSSSDNPTLSITASATASASTFSKPRTIKNRDKTTETTRTTPTTAGRKPRGRPPGSKNKPKPPVVITRETSTHNSVLSPVILEISPGADIIDSIITFARKQNKGISVISASGSVSTVTLRHLSLHGPFSLISLSGTFLASGAHGAHSSSCFGVTLSAAQGQVFGGVVGGKLTAAGPVVVVGSLFENALFQTLPNGEEETGEVEKGEDGGGVCSGAGVSTGVVYGGSPTPLNCQMPVATDHVMHWGGTPRPPY